MAKIHAIRTDSEPANEPINLSDRAIENLRFIRETMERSTHFTAVPGYGGILMGVTAIVAAYIAQRQTQPLDAFLVWVLEAALAFAIGVLAMWQKSKIADQSLLSTPSRKFAFSFAPPLIAGVAITFGLLQSRQLQLMVPVWMTCYGASVVCGGSFSVRVVPVMGWCFLVLGSIGFFVPEEYGGWLMAASFGLLHIVFGAIIAKRYGG
jgi:hypothetical protein